MNFKFFLFVILIIGISFSRIKTDDVEVSDSIKGVTGTFSGALTGATLNTGNGANELYAMDQNVKSTDSINGLVFKASRIRTPLLLSDSIVNSTGISTKRFIARSGTYGDPANSGTSQPYLISRFIGNDYSILDIGEYSSGGSYWIQVCDALSLGTSYSFCINPNGGNIGINKKNPQYPLDVTGEGRFTAGINASDLRVSDSVKAVSGAFSGAITGTTLNTGNGANELYAMDQNVLTTSDVSFDSSKTRVSVFDSLKLGTGSYLKTYLDTTFYDSLYCDGVYSGSRGIARIIQIGKQITLYQPSLSGTVVASSTTEIRGIPSKFRDGTHFYYPQITISENSVNYLTGILRITTSQFIIQKNGGSLAAGNGGIYAQCITWFVD